MTRSTDHDQRLRRYWDKHASSYDQQMGFFDRHLFRDSRHWICSQALGEVREVAIGTGLNLAHYPDDVRLTGIEPTMLELARHRAEHLDPTVDLRLGTRTNQREPDRHRHRDPARITISGVCSSTAPLDTDRIDSGTSGGWCGRPAAAAVPAGRDLTTGITGGLLSAPLTLLPVAGEEAGGCCG